MSQSDKRTRRPQNVFRAATGEVAMLYVEKASGQINGGVILQGNGNQENVTVEKIKALYANSRVLAAVTSDGYLETPSPASN